MAAPVLAASGAHAGNPTTAPTGTFGTTAAGDILIVLVTNGGADTAPASLTGTTGLTWTKKTDLGGGALTDMNGSLWWARATGNHTGQTVIAATTNSGALAWGQITGAIATGDPFDNVTSVLNASGVNAITGYTPGVNETLVLLGLFTDDNIASATYAATGSPSSLNEAQDVGTTGGVDSQVALASGQQTTATSIGVVSWSNARGAGLYQVAILATVKPPAVVSAVLAAPFGGLAGSATATPRHPAVLAGTFGALTATATATVIHPPVSAVLAAPFGGLVATAAAGVGHAATMAAALGGLVGASSAVTTRPAVLAAPLGGLLSAAPATVTHPATMAAPLGGLAAAGSATTTGTATASAPLGELSGALTATTSHPATLSATLGDLTGSITGLVTVPASLTAPLGSLLATADATPSSPGAPTVPATMTATLGALTAVIAGGVDHEAALDAPLGESAASAAATTSHNVVLTANLGALTATITGPVDAEVAVVHIAYGLTAATSHDVATGARTYEAGGSTSNAVPSGDRTYAI